MLSGKGISVVQMGSSLILLQCMARVVRATFGLSEIPILTTGRCRSQMRSRILESSLEI